MQWTRKSGILLHPTSLPGRYGIGDLGKAAYRWIDLLAASHQKLWQVLPLGPNRTAAADPGQLAVLPAPDFILHLVGSANLSGLAQEGAEIISCIDRW